jgi:hypothetical protein
VQIKPTVMAAALLMLPPLHRLRNRFDAYDKDRSGTIEVGEMREMLRDAGCSNPTVEKAEKAVASFDAYKDGRVHWDEFKAAVDKAAEPVDSRVQPISASLMLYFVGEGIKVRLTLRPFDLWLGRPLVRSTAGQVERCNREPTGRRFETRLRRFQSCHCAVHETPHRASSDGARHR